MDRAGFFYQRMLIVKSFRNRMKLRKPFVLSFKRDCRGFTCTLQNKRRSLNSHLLPFQRVQIKAVNIIEVALSIPPTDYPDVAANNCCRVIATPLKLSAG